MAFKTLCTLKTYRRKIRSINEILTKLFDLFTPLVLDAILHRSFDLEHLQRYSIAICRLDAHLAFYQAKIKLHEKNPKFLSRFITDKFPSLIRSKIRRRSRGSRERKRRRTSRRIRWGKDRWALKLVYDMMRRED